jgi:hypothetical protein
MDKRKPQSPRTPSPYDASLKTNPSEQSKVNTRDQSPYTLARETSMRVNGVNSKKY